MLRRNPGTKAMVPFNYAFLLVACVSGPFAVRHLLPRETAHRQAAPVLQAIGGPEVDLGEEERGVEVRHTFHLQNTSRVPVAITGFVTSCACVRVPKLGKKKLTPDEVVPVNVIFSPPGAAGTAVAHVRVFYESSREATALDLKLSATVRDDLQISPSQLDFGRINELSRDQLSKTIRIESRQSHQLGAPRSTASVGYLSTSVTSDDRDRNITTINVIINTAQFLQSETDLRGFIKLEFFGSELETRLVPVLAERAKLITIDPGALVIDSDEVGTSTHAITIRSPFSFVIGDLSIQPKDGGIALSGVSSPLRLSREQSFTLLVPDRGTESLASTIVIGLDVQNGESVFRVSERVPVYRFPNRRSIPQ